MDNHPRTQPLPRLVKPEEHRKDEKTHAIIGAAMEVHRALGHGFLEAVYQEALAEEMSAREIPFNKEVEIHVHYKGKKLATTYQADFVCHDSIIVELKAIGLLGARDMGQAINYLKASGKQRALLLNFGTPSLQFERIVLNYDSRSAKS